MKYYAAAPPLLLPILLLSSAPYFTTAFPSSILSQAAAQDPAFAARAAEILRSSNTFNSQRRQILTADGATKIFEPVGIFNAEAQLVDVGPGSGHEWIAPGPEDLRGPCPGLVCGEKESSPMISIGHEKVVDIFFFFVFINPADISFFPLSKNRMLSPTMDFYRIMVMRQLRNSSKLRILWLEWVFNLLLFWLCWEPGLMEMGFRGRFMGRLLRVWEGLFLGLGMGMLKYF